ncbi:mitochondrial thiamine pyrophosphate carrier-like [Ptychodera flava]|uniref:mitochondrial thiamine pyrophosphate carrier-like n=1 Tax=Ptychodera flava TaxID=63121 RepID=UPI003969DF6D
MVGFDKRKEVKLTPLEYATAGAISGMVMRVFAQPLDVLKIRFQLQVEDTASHKAKYRGLIQASKLIFREEKISAFWKGHVPAQLLCIVFGSVQFVSFEWVTKAGHHILPYKWSHGNCKPAYHFVCGGIAGCAASVAAQPFDVVRTRLVAQGEPKLYTGISDAVRKMYVREGVSSFYKGISPTLLEIFPHAGLQFGFYAFFKLLWEQVFDISRPDMTTGAMESLFCGAASGICSKAIILPLDVVKKRLQVQGFEKARAQFGKVRMYDGISDCFVRIVKEEGIRGLFKGLSASVVKGAVSVGLTFLVYEQCCNYMRARHR